MPELFERIQKEASQLNESDLDNWVIPSLMEYYDSKLRYLAGHAYSVRSSDSGFSLAVRAFKEQCKAELHSALHTYLFKKEHWRNESRSLNAYLRVVLQRLSSRIHWNNSTAVKTRKLICPLCKSKNKSKQFLIPEDGKLRCNYCTKYSERLADELKKEDTPLLRQEYNIRVAFSLHSKTGLRCPGCMMFIPKSITQENFVLCPYDNCGEFGDLSDFLEMAHPMSVTTRSTAYLDAALDSEDSFSLADVIKADSLDTDAHTLIEAKSDLSYKLSLIKEVIAAQKQTVERSSFNSTKVQKLLMYDAIMQMTNELPEDMVRYLCHRKHSSSDPLQAKIFQKYVSLLENYLPFTMEKAGKKIDIVSLTAPELSLFTGISTYDSKVNDDGSIPNETKEEYIGGRKYKNHGPCFIGKLINVTRKDTGESLMSNVVEYTFSKISTKDLEPDTPVEVTHFRIPSHYEMKGMVFLQRIRRLLVDSIYFRLHKKKREVTR